MTFADRVRWALRDEDAASPHSSALGAAEDAVHPPHIAAARHKPSV